MADIFRRKSLDRLSSPEQLDKMIVINSPMTWLALAGGAIIIAIVVIWGILGRVPITEEGNGILLTESVLTSVYAKTEGVVTKTYVSSGDQVEEGDLLYEVNSTQTAEAIQQLQERIAGVEKVTFTSENDAATADNQPLIEIKNQKHTLSLDADSSAASLEALREEYAQAQAETDRLEQEMNNASSAYYDALAADNSSSVEFDYSQAASDYQEAETLYQQLQQAAMAAPEDEELAAQLEEAKADRDSKEAIYRDRQAAYEGYLSAAGSISADITAKSNAYNLALNQYNTAKSKEESLASEIKTMEVQLSQQESAQGSQETVLEEQFNSTKEATLDQLNSELETYESLQTGQEITATSSGTVYSTFVTNGSMVSIDSEVARISQREADTDGKLQAVYFMSLDSGKNVKEGMKVNVYATNLPKEEYGHMTGTVVSVADYVTSYADLFSKLGDETLANTFSGNGAVLEVVCELDTDPGTQSGFAWSTDKGEEVDLEVGTLLQGSVITDDVPPITMLIPKLKEKFNMEYLAKDRMEEKNG